MNLKKGSTEPAWSKQETGRLPVNNNVQFTDWFYLDETNVIIKGDRFKVSNSSKKYVFDKHCINVATGAEWVDCFDAGQFRHSFRPDEITEKTT